MSAVSPPASPADPVDALRNEALLRTYRIVAACGTPLILWSAWSLWSEDRFLVVVGIAAGVLQVLPAVLPAPHSRLWKLSPVAGLLCLAGVSWVLNQASAMTGVLLWGAAIVAAVGVGQEAALGLVVASALLLLSASVREGAWILPLTPRTVEPEVLARFVLAFLALAATAIAVTAAVVNRLERSLVAATDLVLRLQREKRARAVLDLRLTQSDQDARIGIARRLQRHLNARLTALEASLATARGNTEAERRAVEGAIAGVGELVEHVRAAARQLRPVLLDEAGLGPALEGVVESQLQRAGITYEVDIQVPRHLPPALAVSCCRIVQEAIDNVVQHARATHVGLSARLQGDQVELIVVDNGVGFNPDEVLGAGVAERSGASVFGMRQRIEMLGGSLRFTSARDRGTRVEITLPLIGCA